MLAGVGGFGDIMEGERERERAGEMTARLRKWECRM
jgi:hypothetical protein